MCHKVMEERLSKQRGVFCAEVFGAMQLFYKGNCLARVAQVVRRGPPLAPPPAPTLGTLAVPTAVEPKRFKYGAMHGTVRGASK